MKPKEFTISKNLIILTLLILFGAVVTYDQVKIRKQQARLELTMEYLTDELYESYTPPSVILINDECDSLVEANKLLKKKVDYYFEYYSKNHEINNDQEDWFNDRASRIKRVIMGDTSMKDGMLWYESGDTVWIDGNSYFLKSKLSPQ